jgi:L-asparaginase/Glu-tRNA(Gln) amidotransferase subunit D
VGRPHHLLLKNVSADLTPKQVVQLAKVVKEEFRDETENV